MKLVLLILLGVAYLCNSFVLQLFYPNVSTDYYQYVEFVAVRNRIYEFMFAGFFGLTYLCSEYRLLKSIACFFMVLAVGSAVDKILFGVTSYLVSDIFLVLISILLSIIVYVRGKKSIH